jgi:hypothetical protein
VEERLLKYKAEGNGFLQKDTEKDVYWYTKAIELASAEGVNEAVYLANRAMANLKLEQFRSVVDDAEKALNYEITDQLKLKLLYRQSKAYLGMGNLPKSLELCNKAQ